MSRCCAVATTVTAKPAGCARSAITTGAILIASGLVPITHRMLRRKLIARSCKGDCPPPQPQTLCPDGLRLLQCGYVSDPAFSQVVVARLVRAAIDSHFTVRLGAPGG